MVNKNIPDHGYANDDGSADPELSAALAAWAADRTPAHESRVLAALKDARLLVPVVAVLGEVETDENGLKREKNSDMAVPTLKAGGRTALPAFTSTQALALWDPAARPVAVPMQQALRAAAHEKADTIVLDLAGPVAFELPRRALYALAEGRTSTDPLADPAVAEAVRAAVAAIGAVRRAYLGPGEGDGTLALVLDPGMPPEASVHAVARQLAADDTLRARLVHGLSLALLPAEAAPPGEPLFVRS
ncbi:SseB family protein [Streptomyces indicus]|uniref:SseB protein N-terminal domain-containing protein n=1 Tax=Streptomyces indicus TaxID=417292 RepID=A0A1G8XLF2_9ACTN|nr:SseB family protein [Streptomyces indicus]SDJ91313.1 SseB protein N-terminal domain-containing protein [Streptomyces indicus]